MTTRRGKLVALGIGLAALAILAAASIDGRNRLLEPWYLSRLGKAAEAERRELIRQLTELGSTGVVPILLETALRLGGQHKVPDELAWVREALASPRLDRGLGMVASDPAAATAARLLALQLLAARQARFDELCPGLIEALGDPSPELRRAAGEALAVALPTRPGPLLEPLGAAMEAQASVTEQATLGAALLLWCLQVPRDESGEVRRHAAAALRRLPSPWLISAALGAVEMRRPTYAGLHDKLAAIDGLRPRALELLAALVDARDAAVAVRAREALEYLGGTGRAGL